MEREREKSRGREVLCNVEQTNQYIYLDHKIEQSFFFFFFFFFQFIHRTL